MTVEETFHSVLTFHNTVYPEWVVDEEFESRTHFGVLSLHGHTRAKNMSIHIFHGKLYDWRNRQWVKKINLKTNEGEDDDIDSFEKYYYIHSQTPEEVEGFIFTQTPDERMEVLDEISVLPDLVNENGEIIIVDHTVHMMQQKVHSSQSLE